MTDSAVGGSSVVKATPLSETLKANDERKAMSRLCLGACMTAICILASSVS